MEFSSPSESSSKMEKDDPKRKKTPWERIMNFVVHEDNNVFRKILK